MGTRLVFLPKSPQPGIPLRRRARWILALLVTIWCALAFSASTANAADDDKRLALTREALRRAQQGLQSTQAERDALAQKNAALEAQKSGADKALALATARQRDDAAQRSRLGASVAALQSERDRLQADLARRQEESTALQQLLEATQGRATGSENRLVEQQRLVVALRTLLQRSVQSVSDGERQNHALYEAGQHAIDGYRDCQLHGSSSPDANLLGLGDIRTTSVAEQLRHDMDALATPATAAAFAPVDQSLARP